MVFYYLRNYYLRGRGPGHIVRQHSTSLLAGPGGAQNIAYASEFKTQRGYITARFFLTQLPEKWK